MSYHSTPLSRRITRRLRRRVTITHVPIIPAALVAVGVEAIGQAAAWVPTYSSASEAILISGSSTLLVAVFLVANSVHHHAASNTVSTTEVRQEAVSAARAEIANARAGAIAAARTEAGAVVREEIANIDFDEIVAGAVTIDMTKVIEEKAREAIVGTLGSLALPPAPPAQFTQPVHPA